MSESGFVGQGVCRPESLYTFRVSRFAQQCDAGPSILAAVMACVHAINRVSQERIAVGFPEAVFGEGPALGGVVSACGSKAMMEDLLKRVNLAVASGGLVVQAHDPAVCPRQAFVRVRTQERSTAAGRAREEKRSARRNINPVQDSRDGASSNRTKPRRHSVRIGVHVNIVMHGRRNVIRIGRREASEDGEIMVSTWGLSRASDPRAIPVHG